MPQELYKWEDGGVLKHHCPICAAPLSHEKCRKICIGNHVEWCHRYHSLFRKNWSSRCDACKTTDEQHEKRHREIAELVLKINKFKADEELAAMESMAASNTPRTPNTRTPLTSKALNIMTDSTTPTEDTPKSTKKERKAAKKVGKALLRDKVITTAEIQAIAKILHPEPEKDAEAADDTAEDREDWRDEIVKLNLKYHTSSCNTKSARNHYISKDGATRLEVDDRDIERMLGSMNLDSKAIGEEGELVRELSETIKNDLVHFYDELRTTAREKAGFWRWANKRAYRNLLERGQEWDDKRKMPIMNDDTREEERRDSGVDSSTPGTETEDDATTSRSGSVDASGGAGTVITIPASKGAASASKPPVLRTETANSKPEPEGEGWTQVDKKELKPSKDKLLLSGNGGLHHLALRPKGQFGALSFADVAKDD